MRIVKFFGIFLITFLIGYIFVSPLAKIPSLPDRQTINLSAPSYEITSDNSLDTKNEPEFKPEIFDAPDFEHFEQRKFTTKLVDVRETNNSYRKNEVIAKTGEKWFGLVEENGGTFLRSTKVSVVPEARENYDREVTIKTEKNFLPIFLVKNFEGLKEGRIQTLINNPPCVADCLAKPEAFLNRGYAREFQLRDEKYTLRVKDALTKSKEKVMVLILEGQGKSQIIHSVYYEPGNYVGSLLWMGDLDSDGKLDFYMEFFNYEKGSFHSSLFLSSKAAKGKLVKEIANFEALGC